MRVCGFQTALAVIFNRGQFCSQGTFGRVWGHFLLLQLVENPTGI